MKNVDLDKIKKEKPIDDLIRFGIINVDKPSGPTSFYVTNFLAKQLKLNKTSHMGTLDPQVTGVLPILLGRACRLSDYFMHKNKTYVGIMRLHKDISDQELNEVIKKFVGKIKQLPPVRSRVKREIREREVLSFNILEREDKDILFSTEVQAGTYIRKICDDIGKEIGGAHMLELRRTKAGIFSEEEINNLYDFDKAVEEYKEGNEKLLREMIVPAEIITSFVPSIQINKKINIKQLLTGKPLMRKDINLKDIKVDKFVLLSGDKIIGIYNKVNEGNIIARGEFIIN